MITSIHNPKIKWVRELQADSQARKEARSFVVEGVRLAEEALAAGWSAQLVLYTADLGKRGKDILAGFTAQGVQVEQITDQVMRAASDTETPQGILVVLAHKAVALPVTLDFVFIPDAVRDPGNLGTMLRSAAAAGVQAAFIPPGTVDPWSPKVVRAGMGAHFRLPIQALDWDEISQHLKCLQIYLAETNAGLPYTQADLRKPLALIVGGEAEGAGSQAQSLASARVHIPMPGGSESLNAAVAAGVLLFEVVRQRREGASQ